MNKKLSIFLSSIILLSGIIPAFAEVTEIQLDHKSYLIGESINLKGTVTSDDSGLVTIVLRDPSDKFVLLSQAIIQADNSFEKTIPINEKFQVKGTYNVTAFVLDITEGRTESFDLTSGEYMQKIISDKDTISVPQNFELTSKEVEMIENTLELIPVIENPTEVDFKMDKQLESITNESKLADFVDASKNPQYYLDRYYNEPVYKSWFDRNYPNLTIEEAVGYVIPTTNEKDSNSNILGTEIIPQAEAVTIASITAESENNSEIAQVVLAIGGLAVLFGAVYGIKRKVDDNSKHISINKDIIRKKIISPIIDSNPLGIIQTRLAKGEISIEEYEKLKQRLDKNSR
jgi:hypothetical protein